MVSFKFGNHKSNVKSVERRGIKVRGFMKKDQREEMVLLQDM
jgi:hypothetical protein